MAETTPEMVREMAVETQATTRWIIEKQRQLHSMQAHMDAKTSLQKVTDVYIPSVLAVAGLVYSEREKRRATEEGMRNREGKVAKSFAGFFGTIVAGRSIVKEEAGVLRLWKFCKK